MRFLIVLLAGCLGLATASAQKPEKKSDKDKQPVTITEKTKGMKRFDGFVPFYWDKREGKIWIELSKLETEFLYVHSLATGLGSNPVGLDRGKLGDQKVVHFRRVGPKVLMVQRNLRFRANTKNRLEQTAVEQSFAQSVVWGGKVAAEENGKILVDITSLLMTDMQGVAGTLARTGQGDFKIDPNRSAVYLPRCKAFPKNTEFEAMLTFSGKKPGRYVRQTTPTPQAVTLRQHHSFVKLPDDQYRPRRYDVRCPSISITFADYATPIESELQKQWILRHRLVKKDAAAKMSEPVEPIVYYVDAGAPKLIAEALIEGASWWNEAFEAAGFKNAFQVKRMPADADPMDVRYNVIQWVHRSTRGWSYGGSVIDPRTGEIIKGHVTLGSLRVRQDRLLFEGLGNSIANTSAKQAHLSNCGIAGVAEESTLASLGKNDPVQVALARIRQLSAHEVGHTLGFVHNFAASTYGDRASVMDYPAPRIKIADDGTLDFSDAYGVGIGSWDKIAVRFAYTQFAKGANEKAELEKILTEARDKKMLFVSDADSRPASASHPLANLWDNGTDPIAELKHVLKVRRLALKKFNPQKLPSATTTAGIQQYFVPVYLHHRYQVQAVGKMLGGVYYEYGYARDGLKKKTIGRSQQEAAINVLLQCLNAENLLIRDEIIKAISPEPGRSIRSAENFESKTGRNFDELEPVGIAIDLVMKELFQVERLNRIAATSQTSALRDWMSKIKKSVLESPAQSRAFDKKLQWMKRVALAEHLMRVVDHPKASVVTSTEALSALRSVAVFRSAKVTPFEIMLNRKIERFLKRPHEVAPRPETKTVPPGSPIGG